uniref:Lon proteolytic domain-containing protein n=1 Tax=Meloidogyne javanica TaxID=6303 RepID=A0A915LJY1_MELJA
MFSLLGAVVDFLMALLVLTIWMELFAKLYSIWMYIAACIGELVSNACSIGYVKVLANFAKFSVCWSLKVLKLTFVLFANILYLALVFFVVNLSTVRKVVSTEIETSCNFGNDDGKLPDAIGRFTLLCVQKSVKKTNGKNEDGNKIITKEFKNEGAFRYITVASSTSPNAGKDFLKGDSLVEDTKTRCVIVCENYSKEKGITFDWEKEKFSYEVEPEVKLTGDSLALSLIICIMSFVLKRLPPSDLCCTGAVDACGNLRRVGGLRYKLKAASDAGKSRILLPLAMQTEFEEIEIEQRYGIVACYAINIKDLIEMIFPPKKKD